MLDILIIDPIEQFASTLQAVDNLKISLDDYLSDDAKIQFDKIVDSFRIIWNDLKNSDLQNNNNLEELFSSRHQINRL